MHTSQTQDERTLGDIGTATGSGVAGESVTVCSAANVIVTGLGGKVVVTSGGGAHCTGT